VVANLPSGKAPGPDGFNTDFMKKCWPGISLSLSILMTYVGTFMKGTLACRV
jgi:hypothetical protein